VKVGLGTISSRPARERMKARAKLVFPAPSSPFRAITSPGRASAAIRARAMPLILGTGRSGRFAHDERGRQLEAHRVDPLPVDEPSPLAGKPLPDELSEIAPSAGFQDGDLLVTKRHWGAFAGTPLEQELRSRGIDTVVLTGVSTNGGVESTLRQGTGLGLGFVVVEDACSGQDAEEHRFAFERIFPRLARVRTAEEVLKALA